MRTAAALLALTLTLSAFADAVEEVRQAEIGFAKAFADRDKAKFFSYVADDAVFLSALGTLRGKEQVVSRWSRFFDGVPVAPFSWGPERVEITAAGNIGVSMGPIYDGQARHGGYYSSIWQKQSDGVWKVIVDGPGNPPAPPPENATPFEEGKLTTADGVQLYYRKLGAGPVTLIVPLDFALHDAFRQFADVATVISYDLRNRGKSSRAKDVNTLTIEQDVRDLESVRAQLKVEKFIPVGYSYLGKVVAMYAAAHPERVTRLIQLGPAANRWKDEPERPQEDTGAPAAEIEKWEAMRAAGGEGKGRELCEQMWTVMSYSMVGDSKHASRFDRSFCTLENEWPANFRSTMGTLWPTIESAVLSADELKKITMPVLVIHGTKDRNASYSGGRRWATALPDARLVTVEGGAHASWLDDPVTVFGAIRHFLRGEWPLGAERAK
jgi:pimeloyl-ACP methyl ester carboxylesterase/ketosteroid isomerase-like protein